MRRFALAAAVALALLLPACTQAPVEAPVEAPEQTSEALAQYERAQAAGKPAYVVFHSTTCQPCVELAATIEQVWPDYSDRLSLVDVITDKDPGAEELARELPFQYIPTSFFLDAEGDVVDSYTGPLTPDQLRERLDRIAR